MLYIICYDIADEGRRGRVAKTLLDFGRRLEESVFAANLDEELAEEMRGRLVKLVDEFEDTVHLFPMCGACAVKMEVLGKGEKPEERLFYVL